MVNDFSEQNFTWIETPQAPSPTSPPFDCRVKTTQYPTIPNAPLPAEGPGRDSFNNLLLIVLLGGIPAHLSWTFGFGFKTWLVLASVLFLPILGAFWWLTSEFASRKNDKAVLPGRPIEHYLQFRKTEDRDAYHGQRRIPLETFQEKYFDGEIELNGDMLEVLEWRHDWSKPRFTLGLIKHFLFGFLPEMIVHSKSQDEEQVRDHYDRGDDFYGWFLGPRMIYTSGIISDINVEESLEQLQDNKLAIVCEKIGLHHGDRMLDIGCGWGTLTKFASVNYGANVTGITLGRNQTKWGNQGLKRAGISTDQSRILCMDYREIPVPPGRYNKITCLEMAEHVGVRHLGKFFRQVNAMLDDDGVFFLQIAGLRKDWQFEDFTWGLFMNKYIFPGADASTPLGFVVDSLESAGFEIKMVDTIGVHYSATLWRWYRNWLGNKQEVIAKYGVRWYRIWEYFLAYSTIASRQGTASCFQITCVKNLNAVHRINGIPTQYALAGALQASKARLSQK